MNKKRELSTIIMGTEVIILYVLKKEEEDIRMRIKRFYH